MFRFPIQLSPLELLCLISNSNKQYSTFGTNNEKGTGLGLMLCNEIITRNNGKISIESSENNGSKFTILLTKTG